MLTDFIAKYPDLAGWLITYILIVIGALVNLTGFMLKRSVDRLTETIDRMQLNETLLGNRITAIETICKYKNPICNYPYGPGSRHDETHS